MNILGIETSCDETSASVVVNGVDVLSNITVSSLREHAQFGGIIPEIASRRQIEVIYPITQTALNKAKVGWDDIDAIAVTRSPGLIGSLLVGLCFARGLASALRKPLFEIDHIHAHAYASFLRLPGQEPGPYPTLPAIALIASGGHTSLYKMTSFTRFQLIGQTRDDAAGEAFDKVARILQLGYPGGPAIDRLAKHGMTQEVSFPQAALKGNFDFSFSGVKTAVLYYVRRHQNDPGFSAAKVAYAFQKSVVDVLVDKALSACRKHKLQTLCLGGGVAANSALRSHLMAAASRENISVFIPPMGFCLDNAAMIAGLGFWKAKGRKTGNKGGVYGIQSQRVQRTARR